MSSRYRRRVHFETLDDVLAEARSLAGRGYERGGEWSLGQACFHLAVGVEMALDGAGFKMPWAARVGVRVFRPVVLRMRFPSGIKLRGEARVLEPPAGVGDAEGLDRLTRAVERFESAPPQTLHPSPLAGAMDKAQWTAFFCRHAELHLGMLTPR